MRRGARARQFSTGDKIAIFIGVVALIMTGASLYYDWLLVGHFGL